MQLACERMLLLIAAHEDDALDEPDATNVAEHLRACSACSELSPPRLIPFPTVDPRVFELGPVIGRGGMGRVRIARDLRIGREIAIKELLVTTEPMVARFVREARLTAHLQHPNIIPLYEVGAWPDGTPFYSMRVVDGGSLFDAIRAAPTWRERIDLVPALLVVADAIAFAHSRGVIHRDLSPANILLGRFGETVVIDWGLAKDVRIDREFALDDQLLTQKGEVIGSAAYMPPEQASGGPIDQRVDVYALGAILYHLIAGRAPFVGSTNSVLARVRAGAPEPLGREVSPRLRAIVARAMARDPADRYATAEDFARELRRCHPIGYHRQRFGLAVVGIATIAAAIACVLA